MKMQELKGLKEVVVCEIDIKITLYQYIRRGVSALLYCNSVTY